MAFSGISLKQDRIFKEYLKETAINLPRFSDGRIDYSHADKAFVVVCFVVYCGKILLLKRSNKVRTYQNKWNVVAGYLDEFEPLQEKVLEEIREEIGVSSDEIKTMRMGDVYDFFDPTIQKTWIVHPFLAVLKKKPTIILDFEHTEYVWVKPSELILYDIVPNLVLSWEKVK